jgi:hypothetical protein
MPSNKKGPSKSKVTFIGVLQFIFPLQSAFVPSRNIQDNTIMAHELLHSFKHKRGKMTLVCYSEKKLWGTLKV